MSREQERCANGRGEGDARTRSDGTTGHYGDENGIRNETRRIRCWRTADVTRTVDAETGRCVRVRKAKPSSENGVERGRRRTGRSEDRWETGESGGGGGGIRNRGARWAWGGGKGAAGSAGRVLYRLRRGRRVYLRTVCAPLRRCVRVVPYSRPGEMRSTGRVAAAAADADF